MYVGLLCGVPHFRRVLLLHDTILLKGILVVFPLRMSPAASSIMSSLLAMPLASEEASAVWLQLVAPTVTKDVHWEMWKVLGFRGEIRYFLNI